MGVESLGLRISVSELTEYGADGFSLFDGPIQKKASAASRSCSVAMSLLTIAVVSSQCRLRVVSG